MKNKTKKESGNFFWRYRIVLAMMAIITLAVGFRFAFLTSIPHGIHPDAATNALDSYWAYTNNERQVFYENNFGREGLYFNTISYFYALFGVSYFVFKSLGAAIGVLSVIGMYFLGKEIARGNRAVGLLASFFAAISFWIVLFDRMGFRAVISVFAVVWTSYFFLRALRLGKWHNYALVGLFLGIGMHSYIAFRVVPLALVLGLAYKIVMENRGKKIEILRIIGQYKHFAWTILVSLLVSAPLFLYFYQHPGSFFGRTNELSVFAQEHTLWLMIASTGAALGMYTFFGDPNWRHNISGDPALTFIEGALFIIGLVLVIRYLIKKQRGGDNIGFKTNYFYLLALFVLMILPAGLSYSPGGIPHALRTLNTAPVVWAFMALAAALFYYKTQPLFSKNRGAAYAVVSLLLLSLAASNFSKYFFQWGMNDKVDYEYSENFTNAAKLANARASVDNTFLMVGDSIEIEFFVLNNPYVRRVPSASFDVADAKNAHSIVFTNYAADNISQSVVLLKQQGWKELEGIDFGAGSHIIKVLKKNYAE